jgi:hypothetical protein
LPPAPMGGTSREAHAGRSNVAITIQTTLRPDRDSRAGPPVVN